jgi:hypothetical protein
MRSPMGGFLVVLSLATAVALVLVLLQVIGLRGDLDATRSELISLRQQVEGVERGIPMGELSLRLAELENDIQAWVVAFSDDVAPGDASNPAGGASAGEILERLDQLLDRIEALDDRVDEICSNVPVC